MDASTGEHSLCPYGLDWSWNFDDEDIKHERELTLVPTRTL